MIEKREKRIKLVGLSSTGSNNGATATANSLKVTNKKQLKDVLRSEENTNYFKLNNIINHENEKF